MIVFVMLLNINCDCHAIACEPDMAININSTNQPELFVYTFYFALCSSHKGIVWIEKMNSINYMILS